MLRPRSLWRDRGSYSKAVTLSCAIGRDSVLQNLYAGIAERGCNSSEATVLLGQGRDALVEAVRRSRHAGEGDRDDEATAGDLEHRAVAVRPALKCRAEKIAVGVGDQAGIRRAAVGTVEDKQGRRSAGVAAGGLGDLEYRAV